MTKHPIESAPKDGTWVLLFGGDVDWDRGDDMDGPPAVVAKWSGSYWMYAYYDSGYYGEYCDPTHWAALPE